MQLRDYESKIEEPGRARRMSRVGFEPLAHGLSVAQVRPFHA
jgi:hypothetical protein